MSLRNYLIGMIGGLGLGAIVAGADVNEAYAQGRHKKPKVGAVKKPTLDCTDPRYKSHCDAYCKKTETKDTKPKTGDKKNKKRTKKPVKKEVMGPKQWEIICQEIDKKCGDSTNPICDEIRKGCAKEYGTTIDKVINNRVTVTNIKLGETDNRVDNLRVQLRDKHHGLVTDYKKLGQKVTDLISDFNTFKLSLEKGPKGYALDTLTEACLADYKKSEKLIGEIQQLNQQVRKDLADYNKACQPAKDPKVKIPADPVEGKKLGADVGDLVLRDYQAAEKKAQASHQALKDKIAEYNAHRQKSQATVCGIKKLDKKSGWSLGTGFVYFTGEGDDKTGHSGKHYGALVEAVHKWNTISLGGALMAYGSQGDKDYHSEIEAKNGDLKGLAKTERNINESLRVVGVAAGPVAGVTLYKGKSVSLDVIASIKAGVEVHMSETDVTKRDFTRARTDVPYNLVEHSERGTTTGETKVFPTGAFEIGPEIKILGKADLSVRYAGKANEKGYCHGVVAGFRKEF